MMVGYTHDSTTLWRIWDPEFKAVKAQSEVIFDEDRNAHVSCSQGNEIDIFEPPEEIEYIEEIDNGDRLLRAQNVEADGDGFLHSRIADNISRTDEGRVSGTHGNTDDISHASEH
jgi:hypothetical protein